MTIDAQASQKPRSLTINRPMNTTAHIPPNEIRTRFSQAMSDMYRQEVPQYGTLLDLVADVNAEVLADAPERRTQMARSGELDRLHLERHGAIRLGTSTELATMRRIFAVMGMEPVGYYDLSVAGVPVHSTAFRPITDAALAANPFRVFTSLLRLELLQDRQLREQARESLARRNIFTPGALELTARFEQSGGLDSEEADEFVAHIKETFRWHGVATVTAQHYRLLHDAHRLIADVVCFRGPHINHLTPGTLDIDAAQSEMKRRGIAAKDVIEGPPQRRHPILLRQTSFKALEEPVSFADAASPGTHTARFGEIEQRGMALTRKGRALYDVLLASVRDIGGAGSATKDYASELAKAFEAFPDDLDELRKLDLAFFRYSLTPAGESNTDAEAATRPLEELIDRGLLAVHPIVYEDFLPVSAAGIFQSNLGGTEQRSYVAHEAKAAFELHLGASVLDEIVLYEAAQQRSIDAVRVQLGMAAQA